MKQTKIQKEIMFLFVGYKREVKSKIWKIRSEPIFNIPDYYGNELTDNEKNCFFNALKFINLYYVSSQDNPISQYDNIDIISDALFNEKSNNISYYNIIVRFNDRMDKVNIANFYVTCSTIKISRVNDILYQYAKHTIVEGLEASFTYLKSFIEVTE
ncbi:hypothetical protein ACTA71_003708 [Dictyostelium dimigraforme]